MESSVPQFSGQALRDRRETKRLCFARAAYWGVAVAMVTALAVWCLVGTTLFGIPWLQDLGKQLVDGIVWGTAAGVGGCLFMIMMWIRMSARTASDRAFGYEPIQLNLPWLWIALIFASFIIVGAIGGALVMVVLTLEVQLQRHPNQSITLLLTTCITSAMFGVLVGVASYYWQMWQPGELVGVNQRYK